MWRRRRGSRRWPAIADTRHHPFHRAPAGISSIHLVFIAAAVLGLASAGALHGEEAHAQQSEIAVVAVGNMGDNSTLLLDGARGVDTFTIGSNTYAAVVSEGDSGIQIVDVTDPATPTAVGNLEDGTSTRLLGAQGVAVFTIGSNTYAVVTSYDVDSDNSGIQIVSVTDPTTPTAVGDLGDDNSRELNGAQGVAVFTIGSNTYAAVASVADHGLQLVDVTDPTTPTAVGDLGDGGSTLLRGASGVAVFTTGSNTYAAVTSYNEDGLQIVDVTDPTTPTGVGNLGDGGSLELDGPRGVDVFTIGSNTYAAVASWLDDGLQIVDVTDPTTPTGVGNLGDGGSLELDGAYGVDVFTIGSNTYAAVASHTDDGLQIVDVTDPTTPTGVGNLGDGGSLELDGAQGVAVFTIGTNTYAAVASNTDDGLQLVRLGAEAETPNSPPVAPATTATTAEDTPVTITPAISDPDTSDTPVISAVDNPPNGTATHDDDTITYTPDTDYDGTDAFTYTVSDGTDTAQGTITVTITRDNNDPVLGTIGDQNATPDTQLSITPTVTDADTTDTHRYSISRGTLPAAAAFNTSDGSITWTPVQSDAGQTHTVTITVSDGRGGTDSQTFDITVASLNVIEVAPVGNLKDGGSLLLDTSTSVAVFEITDGGNTNTYAAVTSFADNGLQIVDVTNPAQPRAVGNLEDTEPANPGEDELLLDGAFGVDVFTTGGKTYAAVASSNDGGLQIVDVTDPASPAAAGSLADNNTLLLDGASRVKVFTIGANTYAAVTSSFADSGLQIVDVTDPSAPAAAGNLEDDNDLLLADTQYVDIFETNSRTYAAVASESDDGLQIVDVTDPSAPAAAGNLEDDGSRLLDSAHGVDVFTIGQRTYAAVTSGGDDGLQIVDITNPSAPAAAGNLEDDNSLKLGNAYGVDVFTIGANTYAIVASFADDGLQIADITDPDNPKAAGQLEDTSDLLLATAFDVDVFTINAATYAVATARDDHGIQIVRLDAADATNAPPVAPAETATTPEDTPVTITPAISDPNVSDTPVISAVDDPPNGTATHDDTTITYTPDQDYNGTDTFGYTVSDGTDTTQGTITVTVTRDNNNPVLEKIGKQTVVAGAQLSITPTVTDADPTDTHTYSIRIKDGTLPVSAIFTSSDGSLVWTPAPSDAGTYKVTITVDDGRGGRGLTGFDITVTPADPIAVTPVGSLGDNSTLLLGGPRSVSVFEIGGSTYAAVTAGADDGLQLVDVTNPASPAPVGQLADTEPDGLLLNGAYNAAVFTVGASTYAAVVGNLDHGLQIVDVTDPTSPEEAGQLADDEDPGDELLFRGPRGVDTFTAGSDTYAVVTGGSDNGIQIIDITDPDSPVAAGKMRDNGSRLLEGTYDVAVFEIGAKTYAVVASYGEDGIQIIDISNPDGPTTAGSLKDGGSLELDGARGVAVFEIGANTYAAVASIEDDGIQIIDISNPASPVAAGKLADGGSRELDGAVDVDVFTMGTSTYAVVASANDDGIQIVDVSNPASPTAAGKLSRGSLELDGATGVDVFEIGTSTYAVVASRTDNGIQIVELSVVDDTRPEFASATLDGNTGAITITFSETVDISETDLSQMYVSDTNETNTVSLAGADFDDAAADSDTIQIDLASSQRTAIDLMTTPQLDIAAGAVSDLSRNLIDAAADNTITTASPDSPIPSGRLPDSASLILEKSRSVDTFTIGSNVYAVSVSSTEDGFQIVDISRPDKPRGLGNLVDSNLPQRLLDGARGVATFTAGSNTYAAIASHADDGIQVFSVSDLAHPQPAGNLEDNGSRLLDGATGVATFTIGSNTYAAVTSQHDGGLQLVNVTDPSSLTAPGKLEDGGSRLLADTSSVDTFKRGGSTYAVVASWGDDGLEIIDVSNPSSPAETGRLADDSDMLLKGIRAVDAFEAGGSAYVAVASHGENGLQIVDVSDPANPSPAGKLADGGDRLLGGASGVEIFWVGQAIYAAVASQSDDGLQIVDVSDPDNPAEAGSLRDGPRLSLDAARDLSVFTRGGAQYAVVASDTEGLQIVKLAESTRPAFASAILDGNTGAMTITFADVIDVSETDLSKLYISDINETNAVSLAGAGFDDAAADSDTIRLRLTGPQLAGIAPIVTVQLDIAADAVSDLSGGHIRDSPDNPITTASPDSPIPSGMLPDNAQLLLGGAYGVDVFTEDGKTYAAVASSDENGLQIIDITDPDNPTAAGRLADATDLLLDGANAVAAFRIDSNTYAAVPSGSEGGLQIVDITDPDNPTAAGNLEDTEPANPGEDELLLGGAGGVEIFQVGSDVYAAVTSNTEGGLQIVDITDPDNPTAAGQLADANDLLLDAPLGVDVFPIGGKIYATMTSTSNGKAGLQIIDITDPDNPTAAGQLADANNLLLEGTIGVDVFTIGTKTYAAVSSVVEHGLQIIDVSDPDNPAAAGRLADTTDLLLRNAQGVDIFTTEDGTYAAVTSEFGGLQIIDVSDPDNPAAAGQIADDTDLLLRVTYDVAVFLNGGDTYAVVTTDMEGLQIVKLAEVTDATHNSAPVLGTIGDQNAMPDTQLTITPTVTDADTTDTHTYSISRGTLPAAAVFNTSDGSITWTPVQADAGQTHTVTITVNDGRGGTDSQTFDIVVAETPNNPPVAPNETATTAEDTPVTITPVISDPDTSDTPVISAVENPPNGTATHDDDTITYTPDQDYDGTDTFGYTVSDGTDTAQGTVTVTVTRDNSAPVMGTIGDQNATPGIQLVITPTVTDDDPTDTHTYSISRGTLPAAAVFTTSGGTLIWTPVQADAGQTHTVTITVDDSRGGTNSQTFDIVVADMDTSEITLTPVGNLNDTGSRELDDAQGVAVFAIGQNTYAAVAASRDDGLQIINITDPSNPTAADSLGDNNTLLLGGASSVDIFAIGANTYAAVASSADDGLQIIDVTNPSSLVAVGNLEDTIDEVGDIPIEGFLLDGASSVDIFTINGSTYAAVASSADDGLQIIDVTNPASPDAAGSLGDNSTLRLDGANAVTIFGINSSIYAAVASFADDGLQIVDVTNPASPAAAGSLGDNNTLRLDGPQGVTTFVIGSSTYVAISSQTDSGLQIIDVTNPASPAAAGSLADTNSLLLDNVNGIDAFMMGNTTYVAAASFVEKGLQIIDVTDPAGPVGAGNLADTTSLLLDGPRDVDIFTIGSSTYAAVASEYDDGLQVVRLDEAASSIPPVISLVGDNPLIHELGTPYADPGATTDDGSEVTTDTSQVDVNVLGDYLVTYTATDDDGNTATAIRIVYVRDTAPPTFESATLNVNTGAMTITFSETIAVSTTNLSLLYVSDINQEDTVLLEGAGFDDATLDTETLSLTLVESQLTQIIPMDTPQLDISSGAVSDIHGNQIGDSPDNPITVTADDPGPSFESATLDENTGAMTITFSETVDVSATSLSLLYVSDINQADTVPLTGAEFDFASADVETLSLTLTGSQIRQITPMDIPQLDIAAGAVSDLLGNQIDDSLDNPITITVTERPTFESATLDENTGAMTITFSETVDVSTANLSLLYISDINEADTVPLAGAEFDFASADVETLSLTLAESQIQQVTPMGTPQLDITAGAVSDLLGNQIEESQDNPITVTGHVQTDDGDDGSTGSTSSAGRSSSSGGGGRGGGGGGINIISSTTGPGSAYIASISWDCTAGLVMITAGPSSDDLSVLVRTATNGIARTTAAGQTSDGLAVFTAPMRENETYISVSAILQHGRNIDSDSKSINVDSCIGERTYEVPTSMSTAGINGGTAGQPGDGDTGIIEPPAPSQPDTVTRQPEPDTEPEQPAPSEPDTEPEQPAPSEPDTVMTPPQPPPPLPPDTGTDSGGSCLIATAAYGTELAPQVQALREVRDVTLLSTDSGASFVAGFNSVYYLFSPAIADLERQNPVLRDAIRIAITPMISTLSIMSLAEEGSEPSVLALGVSVIALNIGMYVVAPAAVAVVAARRLQDRCNICKSDPKLANPARA